MGKLRVDLDVRKSAAENAALFYDRSKKSKRKLLGLAEAVAKTKKDVLLAEAKQSAFKERIKVVKKRKRKWFEGFKWFVTSGGFLVIGGSDARSNETVVKKYLGVKDKYFHADVDGAPHCVLLTEGKTPSDADFKEAAEFAGSFSRAWKEGWATVTVYRANPDQVSKETKSGEAMGTGAFMVYGERDWFKDSPVSLAVGLIEFQNSNLLMCGPVSAVKSRAKFFKVLKQGKGKKSDAAKKLLNFFKSKTETHFSLDDLMQVLPAGGIEVE